MSPTTIAIALLAALLVLVPTRRLALAGARRETLALYFSAVWLLSVWLLVGSAPRILALVVLVAYVAPFVTLRAGLDRLRWAIRQQGQTDRRDPPRPPMKDVTPRDGSSPPA